MNNIYLRVDGNKLIGLGHFFRCLSLYEMLKNDFFVTLIFQNIFPEFKKYLQDDYRYIISDNLITTLSNLSSKNSNQSLLIFDGYHTFKDENIDLIKKMNFSIGCIDDLNIYNLNAMDLIINHNVYADTIGYSEKYPNKVLFLGPSYALVRNEFYTPSPAKKSKFKNIIVSMGGSDTSNISLNILKSLLPTKVENINLILGPTFEHENQIINFINNHTPSFKINISKNLSAAQIKKTMNESDVIICSGGVIVLEALLSQIPIICGTIAKDQTINTNYLSTHHLGFNLGNLLTRSITEVTNLILELENSPHILDNICRNQRLLNLPNPRANVISSIKQTFEQRYGL